MEFDLDDPEICEAVREALAKRKDREKREARQRGETKSKGRG